MICNGGVILCWQAPQRLHRLMPSGLESKRRWETPSSTRRQDKCSTTRSVLRTPPLTLERHLMIVNCDSTPHHVVLGTKAAEGSRCLRHCLPAALVFCIGFTRNTAEDCEVEVKAEVLVSGRVDSLLSNAAHKPGAVITRLLKIRSRSVRLPHTRVIRKIATSRTTEETKQRRIAGRVRPPRSNRSRSTLTSRAPSSSRDSITHVRFSNSRLHFDGSAPE